MRASGVSLVTSAVSFLGQAFPGTRANRLLILIYHRVHARPDPMFPGVVDAERFDWQMALLRRYCHPLPLSKGVAGLRLGKLPPRAVAVTFDDGYADNCRVALPILQRHGMTATFFVATGFLDGGRMWNDSIIEAIRRAPLEPLDLVDFGLGSMDLSLEEARGPVAESVIKFVKHLPPEVRLQRVAALHGRVGASLPDDLMMTSPQVRQLADAGMDIGAHTITHPILRSLSDKAARQEIDGSRAGLEAVIGRPIRAFAYPNGQPGDDYTERDRNLAERSGFDYALSTRKGVATRQSDLFQLPRFTPWDQTPPRWLARLLLAFSESA